MRILALSFFFTWAACSPAQVAAQGSVYTQGRWWVAIGAGAEHQMKTSLEVSATRRGRHLVQLGYEFNGVFLMAGEWFGPDNSYEVHTLSAKLGAGTYRRWWAGGLLAGPALVAGARPSRDRQPDQHPNEATSGFLRPAVSAGAEFHVKPFAGAGAGVKYFANFNSVKAVSGYRLSLLFNISHRGDVGRPAP